MRNQQIPVCQADETVTAEVVIVNRQGLHARPVMKFVDTANGFNCGIRVDKGEGTEQVDGKDPMHLMLLAAPKGTMLRIMSTGPDAAEASLALIELVQQGFGED